MRVVTWNLWWRFGPWEERQKAILAVLRELRPDVVGLQEVWECGGQNLAGWLADELGMHWTWAASDASDRWQRRIGDTTVDVGNAVLSRWPVVAQEVLRLPAPEELYDGRLALHARLATPTHEVPFFTTHLTSAIHASGVRREQITALAEFVAAHRSGTDFPRSSRATSTPGRTPTRSGCSGDTRRPPRFPDRSSSTPGSTPTRRHPGPPGTRRTPMSARTAPQRASTTSTSARPAPAASGTSGRYGGPGTGRSTGCGPRTTRPSWPTCPSLRAVRTRPEELCHILVHSRSGDRGPTAPTSPRPRSDDGVT